MKKQFVKPEIKGIRLRENILAGSGIPSECEVTYWDGRDAAHTCNSKAQIENQIKENGGRPTLIYF